MATLTCSTIAQCVAHSPHDFDKREAHFWEDWEHENIPPWLHSLNRFTCIKESILLWNINVSLWVAYQELSLWYVFVFQKDTEQTQAQAKRKSSTVSSSVSSSLSRFILQTGLPLVYITIYQLPAGLRLFQSQPDWPGTERVHLHHNLLKSHQVSHQAQRCHHIAQHRSEVGSLADAKGFSDVIWILCCGFL